MVTCDENAYILLTCYESYAGRNSAKVFLVQSEVDTRKTEGYIFPGRSHLVKINEFIIWRSLTFYNLFFANQPGIHNARGH